MIWWWNNFVLISYYLNNSNDSQHAYMANQYVQVIANAIAQFDNNQHSFNIYTALAWGGLQGTDTWLKLPQLGIDTIAIHNLNAHEEFDDSLAVESRCNTIIIN